MIDLGQGFSLRWTSFAPDRALNPQYEGIPDHERIGAILTCRHGIEGSILLDRGPEYAGIFSGKPRWTVEQEDPLTLTPSIDCGECGCHGYIREGRWID